ncbi:AraC family transcriptional regulator ligand-binding domain-containing protein [Ectopseudomonas mendocina]
MPVLLELTYAQPADTGELRRLFGDNLRFGAPRNRMTFSLSDAEICLPTAAQALHPLHVEYARTWMSEQVDGSLEGRVRRILSAQLSLGISPGLGEVATQLGMSKRSLQHGLMRDEVNFSDLLDAARQRQAASLLRHSTSALSQRASAAQRKSLSATSERIRRRWKVSRTNSSLSLIIHPTTAQAVANPGTAAGPHSLSRWRLARHSLTGERHAESDWPQLHRR